MPELIKFFSLISISLSWTRADISTVVGIAPLSYTTCLHEYIHPSVHVFATLSVGAETLFVEKALLLHITSPFSLQRHAAWEDV